MAIITDMEETSVTLPSTAVNGNK